MRSTFIARFNPSDKVRAPKSLCPNAIFTPIVSRELRNEFLKALSALELNASSSEGDDDDKVYFESEDFDVEDVQDVYDENEEHGLNVDVEEAHGESEEDETVFYYDDLYYEDHDDTDVPDAYDWPDRSALDRLTDALGPDDVQVEDENVLIEPEADGDVTDLGDSGSQDTVEDKDVEITSDSIGKVESLGQEIAGEKKKNRKKKKKANPNKYSPVEDDAFEDVVQDLQVLESIYDT